MAGVGRASWVLTGRTGGNETEGRVMGVMSEMGTFVVVSELGGGMVGRLTVKGVGEGGCV
jgi:hypothetical protein